MSRDNGEEIRAEARVGSIAKESVSLQRQRESEQASRMWFLTCIGKRIAVGKWQVGEPRDEGRTMESSVRHPFSPPLAGHILCNA